MPTLSDGVNRYPGISVAKGKGSTTLYRNTASGVVNTGQFMFLKRWLGLPIKCKTEDHKF